MMKLRNSWMHPHLEVKPSAIGGHGVFAAQDLPPGERLAMFGGDVMLIDEIRRLPEHLHHYPLQIEERFVLYYRHAQEPEATDYFNHSCAPNAGFKGQVFLVAMRNIKKGEEVTFDYAMVISESVGSDVVFEVHCNCGAPGCRGHVTERDWQDPVLQQKYRGFFSQYLAERIERLHAAGR
jgi:SET domain-containing protein